jgi:hypothetical protein
MMKNSEILHLVDIIWNVDIRDSYPLQVKLNIPSAQLIPITDALRAKRLSFFDAEDGAMVVYAFNRPELIDLLEVALVVESLNRLAAVASAREDAENIIVGNKFRKLAFLPPRPVPFVASNEEVKRELVHIVVARKQELLEQKLLGTAS